MCTQSVCVSNNLFICLAIFNLDMATSTSSVNLSAAFHPVKSLAELAAKVLADEVESKTNYTLVDSLPPPVASYVVAAFRPEAIFNYINNKEKERTNFITRYCAEAKDFILFASVYFNLGVATGILQDTDPECLMLQMLSLFCNFWMLYNDKHFSSLLDTIGLGNKIGKIYDQNFCYARMLQKRSSIGAFNDSYSFLRYFSAKHQQDLMRANEIKPKVLWNPDERQSVKWQTRERPEKKEESLAARLGNAETTIKIASENYWDWTKTFDFSDSEVTGKFLRLGRLGSMAFMVVLQEAVVFANKDSPTFALGHLVQAYSYFTATVNGQTGAQFTPEVFELRFDMYLMLARTLSKFGGGGCSSASRALLVKAVSILRTECGGNHIRDIRHCHVLVAAQEVALCKGWFEEAERIHLQVTKIPFLSQESEIVYSSYIIHLFSLLERIENCLAFLCVAYWQNSSNVQCVWPTLQMEKFARQLCDEALDITTNSLEWHCSRRYREKRNIKQISKRVMIYDILVQAFYHFDLKAAAITTKLAKAIPLLSQGNAMQQALIGLFGPNHVAALQKVKDEDVEIRGFLNNVLEPTVRANFIFRHNVMVLSTTFISLDSRELVISNMTQAIAEARACDPRHHRLQIMGYFNDRFFTLANQNLSPHVFPVSTFVPPNHDLRTIIKMFSTCWCKSPSRTLCQCYEVQAEIGRAWSRQREAMALSDQDILKMILKSNANTQLENVLPK